MTGALLLLASAVWAGTDSVVGTWRKPDQSLVEFKVDGTVTAGTTTVGRWEKLRDSTKHIVRFNGALGYHDLGTGKYHRTLRVTPPSTGKPLILDRVDNGPTINPDVPDERGALEMEYEDTITSIQRTSDALSKASAEAAEARQKHEIARLLGKISGWIPIAQRKEAEAKTLENSLNDQRNNLRKLAAKLGKPAPSTIVVPAQFPQPPVQFPQIPGQPPGVRPPSFVP